MIGKRIILWKKHHAHKNRPSINHWINKYIGMRFCDFISQRGLNYTFRFLCEGTTNLTQFLEHQHEEEYRLTAGFFSNRWGIVRERDIKGKQVGGKQCSTQLMSFYLMDIRTGSERIVVDQILLRTSKKRNCDVMIIHVMKIQSIRKRETL